MSKIKTCSVMPATGHVGIWIILLCTCLGENDTKNNNGHDVTITIGSWSYLRLKVLSHMLITIIKFLTICSSEK